MKRIFLVTAALAQLAAVEISIAPMYADAKGTVRVQQANGSVQSYDGVTFRVNGRTS